MRIPKIIKDMPWPSEYNSEKYDVKILLDWPEINDEKILVATFLKSKQRGYWQRTRNFRLICSRQYNTAAILYEGAKQGQRQSLQEAYRNQYLFVDCSSVNIKAEDEKQLLKWLGISGKKHSKHGIRELMDWVDQAIEAETQKERDARGELRDEDVYLCPEELPQGLVKFILDTVLPQDDVLIYKKGNVRGLCYQCRKEVRAKSERFASGRRVTCPNCGAQVIAHLATGVHFRVDYVEDIVTIQKGTDGQTVFLRQWHLKRDPTADWENIPSFLEEVCRYAIRGKRVAKWQHEVKYSWYMNSYRERITGWERVKSVSVVYDGQYYFYLPEDWRQQFEGTSLRYCCLDEYASAQKNMYPSRRNTIRFLMDWVRYPAIEKFFKAGYKLAVSERIWGLDKATQHTIRWSRNGIREALQFPTRFLKIHAPAEWTMHDFAKVTDLWKKVTAGELPEKDLQEMARSMATMDDIKDAIGHASIHKILKYIGCCVDAEREQRRIESAKAEAEGRNYWDGGSFDSPGTYRDYLKDCKKLNLDLDDPAILFPPDLDAAHARTIAMVKHKANEKSRKAFQEEVERLSWMQWQKNGLLIRLPVSGDELVAEGAYLHHCVGGYVDRMANGKTTILLIRRTEEPDKPFFTLEWLSGHVQQCKTMRNGDYKKDPEVSAFVEEWVQKVALKGKKKKRPTKAA